MSAERGCRPLSVKWQWAKVAQDPEATRFDPELNLAAIILQLIGGIRRRGRRHRHKCKHLLAGADEHRGRSERVVLPRMSPLPPIWCAIHHCPLS